MLTGKRILIILWSLELGGAERQALHLAKYLRDQGAMVEVWGFHSAGQAAALCEHVGIPWKIIKPLYRPRMAWGINIPLTILRFSWEIRRFHAHALLSFTPPPNVLCAFSWRLAGAQTCIWNQRSDGMDQSPFDRLAARCVPGFTANSSAGKDFLIRLLNVNPERVQQVKNGISLAPPEADRTSWRLKLGLGEECFIACMVANLSGYKDHQTLLSAWKLVTDEMHAHGKTAHLLLAGKAVDTYPLLQRRVNELRIQDNVTFLGMVQDVSGLLSAVDLGVFSSVHEGMPNGVLECMASGLAVCGTNIPALREALGEESHPYLSDIYDHRQLAGHILALAEDTALRAELGAANHRRIEDQYSLLQYCHQMATLLKKQLEN